VRTDPRRLEAGRTRTAFRSATQVHFEPHGVARGRPPDPPSAVRRPARGRAALAACSSDGGDGGTSEATDRTEATAEGTDPLPPLPDDVALPIVFVHGFADSAQQVESNAMRFVANGYPADRIVAYDHDGAGLDIPGYAAGLTEVVDETLAEFDVEQVYLIGHSRGTAVGNLFLSDPAQAAKVAKYFAFDGRPCLEPQPVPCLAPNQGQFPGQTHVEVATSKESFAAQYEFLVGEAPEVVGIVPQREPVEISGRAVTFPAHTGREATLDIWAIDSDTGARTGRRAARQRGARPRRGVRPGRAGETARTTSTP
jgi:pimeloyl-ACP methyl ester carboxylesterase